ncbi:MAG: PqqD family protein [Bacteroidetes bacterium]|nr:PqqD family protein [Bacteroidota bacterium]
MRINKNIAISETGLLFHPGSGESYSVNPIGVEIINLMKEGSSFDEIAGEILSKYNTDRATFEKDYHDFIRLMKENGLLEEQGNETEG